jgi:hypothetical protein
MNYEALQEELERTLGYSVREPFQARLGDPTLPTSQDRIRVPNTESDVPGQVYIHSPAQGGWVYKAINTVLDLNTCVFGDYVLVKETASNRFEVISYAGREQAFYRDNVTVNSSEPVTLERFNYGLLQPTDPPSMRAMVSKAVYDNDALVLSQETIDFTAQIPASANMAKAIRVDIDPSTGLFDYVIGSEFSHVSFPTHEQALAAGHYPPADDPTLNRTGWIRLVNGMTAILRGVHIMAAPELLSKGALGADVGFNVLNYGAVGDGTTDDTAAIQAAVSAAQASAVNGIVYFPGGKTYKITDTIDITTPITLIGAQGSVTSHFAYPKIEWGGTTGIPMFQVDVTGNNLMYSTFRYLFIGGKTGSTFPDNAIVFKERIDRDSGAAFCQFNNTSSHALVLEKSGTNGHFEHLSFDNIGGYCIHATQGGMSHLSVSSFTWDSGAQGGQGFLCIDGVGASNDWLDIVSLRDGRIEINSVLDSPGAVIYLMNEPSYATHSQLHLHMTSIDISVATSMGSGLSAVGIETTNDEAISMVIENSKLPHTAISGATTFTGFSATMPEEYAYYPIFTFGKYWATSSHKVYKLLTKFMSPVEIDDLQHIGSTLGFYNTARIAKPTVSGSRGGNAALASLITALENLGLITDSSSA